MHISARQSRRHTAMLGPNVHTSESRAGALPMRGPLPNRSDIRPRGRGGRPRIWRLPVQTAVRTGKELYGGMTCLSGQTGVPPRLEPTVGAPEGIPWHRGVARILAALARPPLLPQALRRRRYRGDQVGSTAGIPRSYRGGRGGGQCLAHVLSCGMKAHLDKAFRPMHSSGWPFGDFGGW